ncbi:MAG: hypothetical protein WC000_12595 [Dokdonella sp.]
MSRVKHALRLFASPYASRETRHHNVRQWLRAMDRLGNKHVYQGGRAKWGYGKDAR